jgi:hypothetical protein
LLLKLIGFSCPFSYCLSRRRSATLSYALQVGTKKALGVLSNSLACLTPIFPYYTGIITLNLSLHPKVSNIVVHAKTVESLLEYVANPMVISSSEVSPPFYPLRLILQSNKAIGQLVNSIFYNDFACQMLAID